MIEAGLRVVCVDGYCYEDYRGMVVEMVQRNDCICAVVSIDGSGELVTELASCLVGEEQFDSGDF